jgi:hypothetical protein
MLHLPRITRECDKAIWDMIHDIQFSSCVISEQTKVWEPLQPNQIFVTDAEGNVVKINTTVPGIVMNMLINSTWL